MPNSPITHKRLFVAIPWQADAAFEAKMAFLKHHCKRDNINWTPEAHYHLTLAFLGRVKSNKMAALQAAVAKAAEHSPPFPLQLTGLKQFGSRYHSRVLWFAVAPSAPLMALHQQLLQELKAVGIHPYGHSFVPHISVARVKKLADRAFFQKVVEALSKQNIQQRDIRNIHLIESQLHNTGAQHYSLGSYPFNLNPHIS